MDNKYRTQSLLCASCGASLTPRAGGIICSHCGAFQLLLDEDTPAPQQSDNSGDAYAYRGIQAYNQADYVSAIRNLEEALALKITRHNLAEILTVLGNAYDEIDNSSKAISCYQRALDQNPRCYQAWVGLGVTHRRDGNTDEAARCYHHALKIESNYAGVHANLGALYLIMGDDKKSIESLEKAIALNPALAIVHGNIAVAYAMVKRFDRAELSLKQAIALGYKQYKSIQDRIAALKALD